MTSNGAVIDHPARRLVIGLPRPYDEARARYETLVPQIDLSRFFQMASWQATLDLAEINAPHGFMRYYDSDITAAMAGSPSFWKAKLAVDQPSLLFASYHNAEIAAVGRELDALLAALIRLLGGDAPPALEGAGPVGT